MERPVLAIDLGGTKIITALISRQGEMLAREYTPSLAGKGQEAVIKQLSTAIDGLLKEQKLSLTQLHSISIAAAGAIDSEKGLVTQSPNLPGWRDVPLANIIKEKYRVQTFLINDANAAALGEHRFGAGKGVNNLVLMTIGTGIGGGIIIDGKLYAGASGGAGEIGHMTIDVNGPRCNCGNIGCLEMLASGTAIARDAVRLIREGGRSSLVEMVKNKLENITAEKVFQAAKAGDSLASMVIARAADYLGTGLVNLVNIFNPDVIIIGGGVANMGNILLEPARKVVNERAFRLSAQTVRIIPAELGEDAGVFGAAVFAFGEGMG